MIKNDIVFILYKPAVSGNIGASARALKTMGFSQLRLINPADHLADEALMMAHGSRDLLENARVFGSFKEAIRDLDFIIASTAKNRSVKADYIDSREISEFLNKKKDLLGKVGVVFGTEESGLPNEYIREANVAVTIPMTGPYPSLNLSQAVMIMAYELSGINLENELPADKDMSAEGWKQLDQRVVSILEKCDIKQTNPLYNRILERISFLSSGDAGLLHSVLSRLNSAPKKK